VESCSSASTPRYDAVLVVSFGGPEKPEDVAPFLENVLRGKRVPPERMAEVGKHYHLFGGKSPINDQNRQLIALLEEELRREGPPLPVYWGNMHWHPMLADAIAGMRSDGVKRALAFVTSAYSSYSGCRQYLEHIEAARQRVGPGAPVVDKLRVFFNHPGFIEPMAENAARALGEFPDGLRDSVELIFTAHSIPISMVRTSRYLEQVKEAARLVAGAIGRRGGKLVFQSRSGPPSVPWLEPDICGYLGDLAGSKPGANAVVAPIGFTSDHMEVIYDLDVEARQAANTLGLKMVRAATVGVHPRFIRMIRELVQERIDPAPERLALGAMGASHDVCPEDCCPRPVRGG